MSIFETGLQKSPANYVPLSPVSFLKRAAQVKPNHIAIIDGEREYTYSEFWERSSKLASASVSYTHLTLPTILLV